MGRSTTDLTPSRVISTRSVAGASECCVRERSLRRDRTAHIGPRRTSCSNLPVIAAHCEQEALGNTASPEGDRDLLGWGISAWDVLPWGTYGFASLSMGRDRYAEYAEDGTETLAERWVSGRRAEVLRGVASDAPTWKDDDR